MIIILVIGFIVALVLLFGCTYAIFQRRESSAVPSPTSLFDKKLLKISYAEILGSTNGFSLENLIGEGKYGSVYRAVLKPCEKVVAVKVLKLQLKGAHRSFLAECKALRNIRHRNLAKIITSCSSTDFKGNDFKALVLEYVPNGSLEEWLHQHPSVVVNQKKLDLLQMLNIAIDIATALDYLHNNCGNPIVHCDIKPSNILLGDDLRGLVSDFGLAKFLPAAIDISHGIESTSIGIRGTIGYVAPEYGMGGGVSAKGDIYSFGILLLEMFTGKRPTDTIFTEDFNLHNYVKTALDHRVAEIVDPRLLMVEDTDENRRSYTSSRIESCCLSIFRVGVSCSFEMQNERMDINDALNALQHIRLLVDKSCLVSSRGPYIGEAWSWMWDWRRELKGWEYGELVDLINMLSSYDLNLDIVDAPEWTLNTNATFSVSALKEMLINAMENSSTRCATIPTRWNSWVPSKVNIHCWRANLDRLPTRKNLAMSNIHVADVTCPFCKTADEDSPHLFLHCDFAQHIWRKVFRWCSASFSSFMAWGDFYSFHPSWLSDKVAKKIWDAIRRVVLWVLWLRRNDAIFKSVKTTTEEVFSDIQHCSFHWIVGRNIALTTTWENWLNKPL